MLRFADARRQQANSFPFTSSSSSKSPVWGRTVTRYEDMVEANLQRILDLKWSKMIHIYDVKLIPWR